MPTLCASKLSSDLSAKNSKTNPAIVQIVTQIKETQQNQPMFTIDRFPNWAKRKPGSVELGCHAHGKLEIDYDFHLHYRKMQIDDDLF